MNQFIYRGNAQKEIEGAISPVRLVFKIIKIKSKNDQQILTPEIIIYMVMKRLLSGKYRTNNTFLLLGMQVYNTLNVVSQDLVIANTAGLKKLHVAILNHTQSHVYV
ncbi:MAG: hypothetical protein U5L00_09700 [Desulfovermiculus sp.]|nr:hypothetical protein [Desulfovermiculus sp.]